MKTKHTPEPWKVIISARKGGNLDYYFIEGTRQKYGPHILAKMNEYVEDEVNAARIVACVNGCENINPEAVKGLLEACKQRVNEWHHNNGNFKRAEPESLKLAREAIAKAEK